MKIRTSEYAGLVARQSKSSPLARDCLRAFWTGGAVCMLAQLLRDLYTALGMEKEAAGRSKTTIRRDCGKSGYGQKRRKPARPARNEAERR